MKQKQLSALIAMLVLSASAMANTSLSPTTPPKGNSLDALLKPTSAQSAIKPVDREKISLVRETILQETALILGARAGLGDRSREIFSMLDARGSSLDKRFMFSSLVIDNNVLPPVISESKDVVALEAAAMRVAGMVYRIDEPARFALPTPTWRNWLYLGLDSSPLDVKTINSQNLPQNAEEQAFWERQVRQGYEAGRAQAQAAFDANLALLERTHEGMRRYFDLWKRRMVTAPTIATASELVQREDPSTIAVGTTVFRITAPTDFTTPSGWVPLE